jgi:hypothetical protein
MTQLVAEEWRSLFQNFGGLCYIHFTSKDSEIDLGVGKITHYLYRLDGDHPQTWVIQFIPHQLRKLTLDLGTNPISSTKFSCH